MHVPSVLLQDDRAADSDLIPGVYEGGFKLWEGSIDLTRHLMAKFAPEQFFPPLALQGKKVLELGCGHGLPGILCLMMGAEVHFQDYNAEVLTQLTMPNVISNFSRLTPPGRSRPKTRFFSGDWGHVGDLISMKGMGGEYDYILTSESIYNEESSVRLLETMKRVLRPPHGVAMLASKSYYFGVGGGTKAFRQLLKRDGACFEVSEGSRTIEGQSDSGNKREVLEIKFPDSIAPYFL
jgi:SAM-dependent methyltransferase